jgi:hypothetical protein
MPEKHDVTTQGEAALAALIIAPSTATKSYALWRIADVLDAHDNLHVPTPVRPLPLRNDTANAHDPRREFRGRERQAPQQPLPELVALKLMSASPCAHVCFNPLPGVQEEAPLCSLTLK